MGARPESKAALSFNVFFLSRRLALALLIVYVNWFPAF